MPSVDIVRETAVSHTPRARQLEAMFDVPPEKKQRLEWHVELPLDDRDWNIGLIVGPSGSGKSTVARELFGEAVDTELQWRGASVIDDFDGSKSMEDIARVCQAVGFNTIPAWLRPYGVLSNGERFRVDLARRMLELPDPVVVDEFTSVVDRQVAKIGAHAVQKWARRQGRQFIAVSCHYDIIDWLQPDWTFEPATAQFDWRSVRSRPQLQVEIARVDYSAWRLFAPFHYLTAELHRSATCYVLFVEDRPAAFGAMLYRPHPQSRDIWGLARLVTLPDWQGLGLAMILSDSIGAAYKTVGRRMHTYPAHPSLIRAFDNSPRWGLLKRPGRITKKVSTVRKGASGKKVEGLRFGGRPCAVFEYVGDGAAQLLGGQFEETEA